MVIKNKKKTKRTKNIISIFIGIILITVFLCLYLKEDGSEDKIVDYSSYYNEIVTTKTDAKIYEYVNDQYIESGTIYHGTLLLLDSLEDKTNKYFKIKDLENKYYIKFSDIEASNNYYKKDERYKNYIIFNKNIITNDTTTFYKDDNKMYTINKSMNLPVIIMDSDKYHVEYNGMLMYVMKDDVKEVIDSNNTTESNTIGVPVLNYHFVYRPEEESCYQEICHTEEQFRMHLSYIKDNGYFTPTMNEFEMYLDKKINLPKSVLITIDDGWRTAIGEEIFEMYIDEKIRLPKSVVITIDDGRNVNLATKILEEYKLNATAFIVTSRFNIERDFIKSDYVELQSHSHNLHNVGTCPSGHGQGGGLTCLDDNVVLKDLKTSRELLNGATAFCYPFYEYNSHSIEILKEAGFTMAFAGEYEGGKTKAVIGIDKFRIPRWVIVTYTTMNKFISYVSGNA